MNFRQVIDTYGYPLISKEVAKVIYDARSAIRKGNSNSYAVKQLEGKCINPNTGEKSLYNKSKYKYLLDAPFLISHRCCNVMKKQTVHLYEKKSGNKPIIATMARQDVLNGLSMDVTPLPQITHLLNQYPFGLKMIFLNT